MFHIVDDESAMCALIADVIGQAGYDSMQFYSAGAYLKYMQTRSYQPPVALLTDDMMPHMNGRELAEAVYKRTPDQSIILISSHIGMASLSDTSARFHARLAKPFQINALITLLNDLLIHHLLFPTENRPAVAIT